MEKSKLTEINSFSSALHLNLVINPECPVWIPKNFLLSVSNSTTFKISNN